MKKTIALSMVMVLMPFTLCFSADSGKSIGSVKIVTGSADILREGKSFPAVPGQTLSENDTLRTGEDGSMGVIFRDDTILSMGPNTVISVNKYVFSPQEE